MTKGLVITQADGVLHLLEVHGDDEASIDARIATEIARYPDRRSNIILTSTDPAWQTYWPPPAPRPPQPDKLAFERALLAAFPSVAERNTLLGRYPLFLWALRGGAWADVKALVDDALAKAAITQAQYDQVVSSAKANNIPGF